MAPGFKSPEVSRRAILAGAAALPIMSSAETSEAGMPPQDAASERSYLDRISVMNGPILSIEEARADLQVA